MPNDTQKNIDAFNKVQTEQNTGKQYISGQGNVPNAGGLNASITPPNVSSTISSSNLSNNQNPINLSNPGVSTGAAGLGAEITSTVNSQTQDALAAQTTNAANTAQTAFNTSKDALSQALGLQKGATALTDTAYGSVNDAGVSVDTAAKALKDVNTKINAIDIRANAEQQALKQNFHGGTTEGYAQASADITRNASLDKANLYIDKLVAQGDYDTAKSIADRKVDVQLEQQKMNLDKLQFDYTNNKDLFDKKEQKAFELQLDDRKRALDKTAADQKQFESTKIDLMKSANEQNAPQSVKNAITNATDRASAINAAGQYAGNIVDTKYKQAQIDKINADIKAAGGNNVITNPEAAKYGTALSVILGSDKFTKEQKATITNSINTGGDPFAVVKNQAKNIMGQTEATTVNKYEVARDTLSDIGNQLSQFYAAGGDTGIFSGNFEKVINKLGTVNNPALISLATQIQGNLQIYRNAISGTAYSAQEGKDISSIFPGINKSESLNNAILKGRSTLFDSVIDSSYRSVLGKNYDELKKSNNDTTNTQTVKSNGQDYTVGQVYQDGSGAKWTVDANGKWSKQ